MRVSNRRSIIRNKGDGTMKEDLISRQAAIYAMEMAKEQHFDRKVIIGKMLLEICHPHSQSGRGVSG